ncbi:unnamed protein product [Leuciscus chuanchicus]
MAWNACHTSGPPLHLQLSPTYPSGRTLINLRHLRDATRHAWILSIYPLYSGARASESVFAVALHNGCPREAPRPSFLFSGRSGADSVRKSPLIYTQQLQRREVLLIGCSEIDVALPNFTCRGTWSIKTVPQKLIGWDGPVCGCSNTAVRVRGQTSTSRGPLCIKSPGVSSP